MKTIIAEAGRVPSAKQIEDIVMSASVTDSRVEIERDAKDLFGGAFKRFCLN